MSETSQTAEARDLLDHVPDVTVVVNVPAALVSGPDRGGRTPR